MIGRTLVIVLALSTAFPTEAIVSKEKLQEVAKLVWEKVKEHGPTVAKWVAPIIAQAIATKLISSAVGAFGKREISTDAMESVVEKNIERSIVDKITDLYNKFKEDIKNLNGDEAYESFKDFLAQIPSSLNSAVSGVFDKIFEKITGKDTSIIDVGAQKNMAKRRVYVENALESQMKDQIKQVVDELKEKIKDNMLSHDEIRKAAEKLAEIAKKFTNNETQSQVIEIVMDMISADTDEHLQHFGYDLLALIELTFGTTMQIVGKK